MKKFNQDGSFRHFNNKKEGSLTGLSLNITKDEKTNAPLVFLTSIEFNGKNKGDGVKERRSVKLTLDSLHKLYESTELILGYKEGVKEVSISESNSYCAKALIGESNLRIRFTEKKEKTDSNSASQSVASSEIKEQATPAQQPVNIDFDLNYTEILRFQKQVALVMNVMNNFKEIEQIDSLISEINSLGIESTEMDIFGNNGQKRTIFPTTIEHSSVNVKAGQTAGSHLNFRNQLINKGEDNEDELYNHPITLVTQEAGYSFALTIENHLSIALEKYLKAFTGKGFMKASKFLSDKEERLMRENNILSTYNNKGTNMYQFKIFSESGTVQYSINSKDKSLTVSRLGIATASDVERARVALRRINILISETKEKDEVLKLKQKYEKIKEFGIKLANSEKTKKPYFTSFIKIDDISGFIFKLHLVNSYITSGLKSEKAKLNDVIIPLRETIEKKNELGEEIPESFNNTIQSISEYIGSGNTKDSFFRKEYKLDNKNVVLSYDSRFVPFLMRDKEDKSHKTFKMLFSNNGRNTALMLGLADIKQIIDNNGVWKKEIDYTLDGKKIQKTFEMKEDGTYFYKDSEGEFSGKINADIPKVIESIKKDIIESDLRNGIFYDKILSYELYKMKNVGKEIKNTEKVSNVKKTETPVKSVHKIKNKTGM